MRLHKLNKLKKLKANRFGRDFIVGDLHGCYYELIELLNDVDFDFDTDRLFSVGDLIDRGPESIKCLSLLNEPYFFSVRGNHEDIFCQMVKADFKNFTLDQYWNVQNGGAWSKPYFESDSEDLTYWYNRLARLPMVIEVEGYKTQNPFWIVHAELWSRDYGLSPDNLHTFLTNATTNDVAALLWSRRFYKKDKVKSNINFPGPIYCGHTPVDAPFIHNGHINLDGGAGKSSEDKHAVSKLVLFCHTTGKSYTKHL